MKDLSLQSQNETKNENMLVFVFKMKKIMFCCGIMTQNTDIGVSWHSAIEM